MICRPTATSTSPFPESLAAWLTARLHQAFADRGIFATIYAHHVVSIAGMLCYRRLGTLLGLDSGTHDDSRCGGMNGFLKQPQHVTRCDNSQSHETWFWPNTRLPMTL